MSVIGDLIEQKRTERQSVIDELKRAKRNVDKLEARRDQLAAEIAELQAFKDWQAQQP